MEILIHSLASFISATCFGVIVNVPRRVLVRCGLTGMYGWIVYWALLELGVGSVFSVFCGSMIVSVASIYYAKRSKVPATTFNIPGVFPLVPGIAAYQTVNAFVRTDYIAGMGLMMKTFTMAVAIALAIVMVEVLYSFFRRKFA